MKNQSEVLRCKLRGSTKNGAEIAWGHGYLEHQTVRVLFCMSSEPHDNRASAKIPGEKVKRSIKSPWTGATVSIIIIILLLLLVVVVVVVVVVIVIVIVIIIILPIPKKKE